MTDDFTVTHDDALPFVPAGVRAQFAPPSEDVVLPSRVVAGGHDRMIVIDPSSIRVSITQPGEEKLRTALGFQIVEIARTFSVPPHAIGHETWIETGSIKKGERP